MGRERLTGRMRFMLGIDLLIYCYSLELQASFIIPCFTDKVTVDYEGNACWLDLLRSRYMVRHKIAL